MNDQPPSSEPSPSEPSPPAADPAPPPTSVDITAELVGADCRRLTDFDGDAANRWVVVNDGVMGGRSNGVIDVTDSVMRFTGSVVTAGGGFTSIRLQLDGTELAGSTRVELRVRGDTRTYGLTLEDNAQVGQRAVSHRADLTIGEPDGWTTASLSYDELKPSVFGQPVDAAPFNPEEAREFGIIIADGLNGDFGLEIDWIDACR